MSNNTTQSRPTFSEVYAEHEASQDAAVDAARRHLDRIFDVDAMVTPGQYGKRTACYVVTVDKDLKKAVMKMSREALKPLGWNVKERGRGKGKAVFGHCKAADATHFDLYLVEGEPVRDALAAKLRVARVG